MVGVAGSPPCSPPGSPPPHSHAPHTHPPNRHKGFLKDCPSGYLHLTAFQAMYKRFFPFGQTSPYTEYVWALLDADGDGRVGFEEFVLAMSVATRGELKDRLDCKGGWW